MNFLDLPDLVSETVGGAVLAASDEFFAPKENLIRKGEPRYVADKYTDRGKWMDGWETRRRREPGHDWVVLRLGLPGAVRGVVVDTQHFRGNFPESCSVEVCSLPGNPGVEDILADDMPWHVALPVSRLKGHSKNKFAITDCAMRVTHVRLNIFPDGGVARFRIHGEVLPDWPHIDFRGGHIDLAAVENGGRVVACSDMFFSQSSNLIRPGQARNMGEGWETRRRRGPGHDWAIVALGTRGTIDRIEVDTSHFLGNAPGWCSLDTTEVGDDRAGDVGHLTSGHCKWRPFLPRVRVLPNIRQLYESELEEPRVATHVRFNIYPDGGVARLRLYGITERSAGIRASLTAINASPEEHFEADMLACCGSASWAHAMARARPFADVASLVRTADRAWDELDKFDWLEAIAAHPRIGEKQDGAGKSARWSQNEQSGVIDASAMVLDQLARANQEYYDRFGFNFLVHASGKSADYMLELLRHRLSNDSAEELRIAAEEQRKITRLRLGKLLRSMASNR